MKPAGKVSARTHNQLLKQLPAVHEVLLHPDIKAHPSQLLKSFQIRIVREVIQTCRKALVRGDKLQSGAGEWVIGRVRAALDDVIKPFPNRVINGTGVLIHTNLGRAPLGAAQLENLASHLSGYSNLEFELAGQKRGSRDAFLNRLLTLLTGAESALVVNNNASALMLILNTLAKEAGVLVSRGELVEIGGSFRIPDIIQASGCMLKEVGTTNKTKLSDFEKHSDEETKVLLKVHRSNFVQRGFVASVELPELLTLAKKKKCAVVEDNGSGLLMPSGEPCLAEEPVVSRSLKLGVPVVCFSGDKLMGGIQAGIILGKSKYIGAMVKNPLYRVLRLDKVRIGLLSRQLQSLLQGEQSGTPLWRHFNLSVADLKRQSKKIKLNSSETGPWKTQQWEPLESRLGGGSNPESPVPGYGLVLEHKMLSAAKVKKQFAQHSVPIIGYTHRNRFMINIKAFFPGDYREFQLALDSFNQ